MSAKWGATKWGDIDDEGKDVVVPPPSEATPAGLPERTETKPNKDGIKKITEFYKNDEGKTVKVVKTVKVAKKVTRVPKVVTERRKWAKFGACEGKPDGPEDNITYVDNTNEQFLDFTLDKKEEDEKEKSPFENIDENKSIVVCRLCGETGHWTLRCPKRNDATPNLPGSATPAQDALAPSGGAGRYVPPSRRGGGGAGARMDRDDSNTLRVSNISEETTEHDLGELFSSFGRTSRIFLAKDKITGQSRGFAFISYIARQDAEAALEKLNGYGYDNLILHVEWAKPREDK